MSLQTQLTSHLASLSADQPVLIAGPTASGKSALALEIAQAQGGVIVNADALQVFENWNILTARPPQADLEAADHALYGHIGGNTEYSVGHWLRDVEPILTAFKSGGPRPIITGGTGLYFSALTEGLAHIPATPPELRLEADARRAAEGDHAGLLAELDAEDPETAAKVDRLNPMRVQRAWEVLRSTGKGMAAWHRETPAALLPLKSAYPLVMDVDTGWLNERIARRFGQMIEGGALDEARSNAPNWDPARPSSKAIGAPELMDYLSGSLTIEQACEAATIATRQFAKRQRTWFRARMKAYHKIQLP